MKLKGQRCVPIEEMKQELVRRKVDLRIVNEWRTSKLCYNCWFKDNKNTIGVMDKHDHGTTPVFEKENRQFEARYIPSIQRSSAANTAVVR